VFILTWSPDHDLRAKKEDKTTFSKLWIEAKEARMKRSFWKWHYCTLVLIIPLALVLSQITVCEAGAAESASDHHEAASMPVTGKGHNPTAAQDVPLMNSYFLHGAVIGLGTTNCVQ
jgi:hypothetical protein